MSKRVLILDGHPGSSSFCASVAESYRDGATKGGNETKILRLSKMTFDPDLGDGYKGEKDLEKDLALFQEAVLWCDHLTLVHPLWWGGMPAKLKGLIDRTLLPGFAYSHKEGSAFPEQLLKGRTAHVLVTSDTPSWYLHLVYRAGGYRAMKKQILEYCGLGKIKFSTISPIQGSKLEDRKKWLKRSQAYGAAL